MNEPACTECGAEIQSERCDECAGTGWLPLGEDRDVACLWCDGAGSITACRNQSCALVDYVEAAVMASAGQS